MSMGRFLAAGTLLAAAHGASLGAGEPCHDAALTTRALHRLNALRAEGLTCGHVAQAPAPPLAWSARLTDAAAAHAQDMAERNQMAHTGRDGSRGGDRLLRAGYDWQVWAENLGTGTRSVDELMRLWAASPGHCANLMLSDLQQMGLACAVGRNGRAFWSLTLGTLR
jgi:uncharacterized protein YkwD